MIINHALIRASATIFTELLSTLSQSQKLCLPKLRQRNLHPKPKPRQKQRGLMLPEFNRMIQSHSQKSKMTATTPEMSLDGHGYVTVKART